MFLMPKVPGRTGQDSNLGPPLAESVALFLLSYRSQGRVRRVYLPSSAWKAEVLPLNNTPTRLRFWVPAKQDMRDSNPTRRLERAAS
jgi:hypothetical protein